jgi:ferredoxin
MGHNIALNFEDGVTRFIECRPDETIADASYRVGINIPLDCRDGVCGTCKCRVEAGEYDRGSYLEDALTEEEAAEGLALACQTRPKTDLVVAVAASSEFCRTGGADVSDAASFRRQALRDHDCVIAGSGGRVYVLARPIRQHPGAGHRPTTVLFLQLTAGGGAPELSGAQYPARGDEHLSARKGGARYAGRVHRPGR